MASSWRTLVVVAGLVGTLPAAGILAHLAIPPPSAATEVAARATEAVGEVARPVTSARPAAEGGVPLRAAPAGDAPSGGDPTELRSRRVARSWWGTDPLSRQVIAAGLVPETARPDDRASVLAGRRGAGRMPSPATVTDEGFHVVAGTSSAGAGATVRFTVELDPALGASPTAVADVVEDALYDPRSWARDVRFERVDDPAAADIRVLLAHPDVVDQLCGDAGLDTEGRYSCWTGAIAALNAWRWEVGADDFADLDIYRRYLVNHEVGHGLGHGHVGCPAPDAQAPVMMQQSITTAGCVANGWPYPEG